MSPKRGMMLADGSVLMTLWNLHGGAIMHVGATMTPWMRRRVERYLKRGTSERMIACLMSAAPSTSGNERRDAPPADWHTKQVDLSNVILFRALGGTGAGPASRAS